KRVAWAPGDAFVEGRLPMTGWTPVQLPRKGHPSPHIPLRQGRMPDGFIFVLGDNKLDSVDSRDFGLVPLSRVRAKLVSPKVGPPLTFDWLPRVPSVA